MRYAVVIKKNNQPTPTPQKNPKQQNKQNPSLLFTKWKEIQTSIFTSLKPLHVVTSVSIIFRNYFFAPDARSMMAYHLH